jgi:hypothetical protein
LRRAAHRGQRPAVAIGDVASRTAVGQGGTRIPLTNPSPSGYVGR